MSKEKLQSSILIPHSFIQAFWDQKVLEREEFPLSRQGTLWRAPVCCLLSLPPIFAPISASAGGPHQPTAWPHGAGFALYVKFRHHLPRRGHNLVFTVGWSNLAIYLHDLNAYSLLESTFEMALNFETIKFSKNKSELKFIIFPKFATFQL